MPSVTPSTQRILSRDILKQFLPNHEAIRAFEQALQNIDTTLPTTIEEVANVAATASAEVAMVAAQLQEAADELALIAAAPAAVLGTMAPQNADAVDIDGGSIDGTPIGATAASTGNFSTLVAGPTTVTSNLGVAGSINGNSVGAVTFVVAGGGFGCNGKSAQSSVASGGAVSTTGATNTTPFGYTTAAQANDIVTKLNTVIAALVANGILS